jgi:DNA-binding NarL/FixJ family response regulator
MGFSVLLVEDDAATCRRLERTVESTHGLSLQAAVRGYHDALKELERSPPDVALIDLVLPDGDGLDLIARISADCPQTRSMVITMFNDEERALAAICAGASGYLLKDASDREIGEGIMQVLQGGSPISPGIARYLLQQVRKSPAALLLGHAASPVPPLPAFDQKLTPRELEVLQLVADGASYAEVGTKLDVSINTVRTHIRHLYDKLAVKTRGKLVSRAETEGLIRWKRTPA